MNRTANLWCRAPNQVCSAAAGWELSPTECNERCQTIIEALSAWRRQKTPLREQSVLGSGSFGVVLRVELNPKTAVAVKLLRNEKDFRKTLGALELLRVRGLWEEPAFWDHFVQLYDCFQRTVRWPHTPSRRKPPLPVTTTSLLTAAAAENAWDERPEYLLVMEQLDGDLVWFRRAARATGGDDFALSCVIIAQQTLTGLSYLFDAGLAHTDLKPENIMVRWLGGHRVFAKIIDIDCVTDQSTYRGCVTPSYADIFQPDEYLQRFQTLVEPRAREQAIQAADLYKLALTWYWLCTGVQPLLREITRILRRHASDDDVAGGSVVDEEEEDNDDDEEDDQDCNDPGKNCAPAAQDFMRRLFSGDWNKEFKPLLIKALARLHHPDCPEALIDAIYAFTDPDISRRHRFMQHALLQLKVTIYELQSERARSTP